MAVITTSGAAPTLGLGAQIDGVFRLCLVVAGVGLLLLAGAILLGVRARRRRRADPAPSAGEDAPPDEPASLSGSGSSMSRAVTRQVKPTRVMTLAFGAGAAVSLSGCLALPQATAGSTGADGKAVSPLKVALAPGQEAAMLADYDARNTAVIAGLAGGADEKTWEQVDTGVIFATDLVNTRFGRAGGEGPVVAPSTHTVTVTFVPSFSAYPLWVVVASDPSTTSGAVDKPASSLLVFEKASVLAPWRMSGNVSPTVGLPAPSPTPQPAQPPDQVAGAAKVATATATYLTGGAEPGFDVTPLKAAHDVLSTPPLEGTTATSSCQLWAVGKEAADSIKVVRTGAGWLAVTTLRCTRTITAPKGGTVNFKEAYAKAIDATTDARAQITDLFAAQVVTHRADDGTVTAVGGVARVVPLSTR